MQSLHYYWIAKIVENSDSVSWPYFQSPKKPAFEATFLRMSRQIVLEFALFELVL